MIKKALLTGILALSLAGCTNPVGKVVDYFENGSRKAKLSDYKGLEDIKDLKKQVEVYDNFVMVNIGEFESERESYLVQEDKWVEQTVKRPYITYRYCDYNNDGNVDEYAATNNAAGRQIMNIHSEAVWDAIYAPKSWTFNNAQKYADKNLQSVINEDYKTLREKGTRLGGKAYTPAGTWFEEYPIKMDEQPRVKIKIELKKD